MNVRELICPMCFYKAKTHRSLICHCLTRHRHDGCSFVAVCTFGQCGYQTHSYNAFKLHSGRKHGQFHNNNFLQFIENNSDSPVEDEDADAGDAEAGNYAAPDRLRDDHPLGDELEAQNFSNLLSKFFLSLEIDHKVSKFAVDSVASLTGHLINKVSKQVLKSVVNEIPNLSPDEMRNAIRSVNESTKHNFMDSLDPFLTTHQRSKVYRALPTFIKPKKIRLGTKCISKGTGHVLKHAFAYYVPLKDQLQLLLKMPEIVHFLSYPAQSTDGTMSEVEDCPMAKVFNNQHRGQVSLKLSLSYDDVEIQNPLRSNHRHKLAMMYFSLLNIPAKMRSKLKCIFLVGIARTKDLQRFGVSALLEDFISTVNGLSSQGVQFELKGQQETVWGKLMYAVCDNPAAGYLGGFKEAAGFSRKACRRCYADQESMRRHFNAKQFRLRNKTEYLRECEVLQDRNLSKQNRQYWSKIFGLNGQSCLSKVRDFDVTSQLIQDPMHVLLEGICGHLLALFLNRVIYQEEYLTLEELNGALQNYPYLYADKSNRPDLLQRKHIVVDNYVRQKASSMLVLFFTLPHILGKRLPEGLPHYRHFIYLVQIVQITFAPICDADSAGELELLIELFGRQWTELYPGSQTRPKAHYLCHFVEQMKEMGSLHSMSAMRYEAKHFFFKDFRWKNYTNLPYSLAEKHQLYLAHKCLDVNGGVNNNFLYAGDEVAEGDTVTVTENSLTLHDYLERKHGYSERYSCYETDSVSILGNEYRLGAVVLIDWDEFMTPQFGVIEQIVVHNEDKICVVGELTCLPYEWQWHSYRVQYSERESAHCLTDLHIPFPLKLFNNDGDLLVMNRYAHWSGGV